MLTHAAIILGFILPAILVMATVLVPLGRAQAYRAGLIALALAAGFALAYWHTVIPPRSPGLDTKDWLFYITIPLAGLAIADNLLQPPLWLRAISLVLLVRLAIRLILIKQIPHNIDPCVAEMYIDLISVIALTWWLSLETLAARITGPTVPLILWLIAAGVAAGTITFPSIQNATLAAALSLFAFIIAISCYFCRNLSLARGPVLIFTFLLILLMTHGYFFSKASDTPDSHTLTLLAIMLCAPIVACIADLPGLRAFPPKALLAIRLAAVLLAISVVVPSAIHYVQQQLHPTVTDEE